MNSDIFHGAFLSGTRLALLLAVLAVARTDIVARRIPNLLVLAVLIVGIIWHSFAQSGNGLFDRMLPGGLGFSVSALGGLYALGVFLLMHLLRFTGAGDVKLMAALGTVFGEHEVLRLTVLVIFAGGLLVVLRTFNTERRHKLITNLKLMALGAFSGASGGAQAFFDPKQDTADRMPFGVALVGGAMALAALIYLGYA